MHKWWSPQNVLDGFDFINCHHPNLLNGGWLKDILSLNDHQLLPRQLLKVALHDDDDDDGDAAAADDEKADLLIELRAQNHL